MGHEPGVVANKEFGLESDNKAGLVKIGPGEAAPGSDGGSAADSKSESADSTGVKISEVQPFADICSDQYVNILDEHFPQLLEIFDIERLGRKVTIVAEIEPPKPGTEIYWSIQPPQKEGTEVHKSDRAGFGADRTATAHSSTNCDGKASIDFYLPPFGAQTFQVAAGLAAETAERLSGKLTSRQLLCVEMETMNASDGTAFQFPDGQYRERLHNLTNAILSPAGIVLKFYFGKTNELPFEWLVESSRLVAANDYFSAEQSPYQLQLLLVHFIGSVQEEGPIFEAPPSKSWTSKPIKHFFYNPNGYDWLLKDKSYYLCPCGTKFGLDMASTSLSAMDANKSRSIVVNIPEVLTGIGANGGFVTHACEKPNANGKLKVSYRRLRSARGRAIHEKNHEHEVYLALPSSQPAAKAAAAFSLSADEAAAVLAHEICHTVGMLPEGKGAIHTAGSTLCHCTDPGCLMYFERDPTAPQAKLCEKCLQILKRTDLSKQISKFKAQKGGKA